MSIGAYTVIGAGARVGARTRIHPHVTVYPGVEIGADCAIHSGVHLHARVRLGDRVVVQSGAVLGSEGFGFAVRADGSRVRIRHRSGLEIGDDVEIGANTTIDASHPGHPHYRAETSATRIGRAVKIDNLVQVGHGCSVGDGTTLSAQVGLAGSTEVGRNAYFGGMSASAGHLSVGDGTLVGARAALGGDTEPGAQLLGVPAIERRLWGRVVASWKRLPGLLRRVRRIEKKLGLSNKE